MRELVEKTVDGHVYAFEQFTTTLSLTVFSKLTKIFGESLSIALGTFFGKDRGAAGKLGPDGVPVAVAEEAKAKAAETQADALTRAVRTLLERLDETEVVDLVKKLTTQGVLCDGVKIVSFDEHFRGEFLHLFSVVAAALDVQYGNFIRDALAKVGAVLPDLKPTPLKK